VSSNTRLQQVGQQGNSGGTNLAELLGVLSLATDLGMGQPMEHMLRQCLIALRLSERMGLDESARGVVYYTSLLAWVGCNVDAYEQAKWFGDEFVLKADARLVDFTGPAPAMRYVVGHFAAGKPVLERARLALAFLAGGHRDGEVMLENHWRAVDDLMLRLGLAQAVRDSVGQTFARWDGKGVPRGLGGEDILIPSRLVNLADVVEMFHRTAGVDAALTVAAQRAGTQFDPAVVEAFSGEAAALFAELDDVNCWDAVMTANPASDSRLTDDELDNVLEAFADFVDVKSPYTIGHSRGVADLAEDAARACGLNPSDVTLVRRAALVHDLGRLGVSNSIWDKQAALSHSELERVRLHPYLTERMLASSTTLAPLARIAVQHHERLDGSGYPRGLSGDSLSIAGRLLAAADVYHASLEPRPHRGARSPDDATTELRTEVRAGRLDGDAVEAVLGAAGHRVTARRDWPAGLTSREVEVLRLLARGLSSKQIAERLVITPKTASNHIEHIYSKVGVTNRALASLFAAKHGLISG
jgi:HD-GYP domain-containing protein (c-di-GMP phosphodiesterase class II)/DNA-binding CsgD family transcriptional regulator